MSRLDEKGQTETSKKKNVEFFLRQHSEYAANVANIDSYQSIKESINREITGINRLLDIGNGGVFDYDTRLVNEIVGLDLFLESLPRNLRLPPNVVMKGGSALDIPRLGQEFDGVIMVMLIHHLVGATAEDCENNVRKAITEAYRVLRNSGKLIIVDSCIPAWFYSFEKLVFPVASKVIEKSMTHPPVLQYTREFLVSSLNDGGFGNVRSYVIPKGKYILQFGFKVPSWITPTQPTVVVGEKFAK